jgi:hypothetical protein
MQVGLPKPKFIGFIITNVANMNYNAISKMYGDDQMLPWRARNINAFTIGRKTRVHPHKELDTSYFFKRPC